MTSLCIGTAFSIWNHFLEIDQLVHFSLLKIQIYCPGMNSLEKRIIMSLDNRCEFVDNYYESARFSDIIIILDEKETTLLFKQNNTEKSKKKLGDLDAFCERSIIMNRSFRDNMFPDPPSVKNKSIPSILFISDDAFSQIHFFSTFFQKRFQANGTQCQIISSDASVPSNKNVDIIIYELYGDFFTSLRNYPQRCFDFMNSISPLYSIVVKTANTKNNSCVENVIESIWGFPISASILSIYSSLLDENGFPKDFLRTTVLDESFFERINKLWNNCIYRISLPNNCQVII